LGTPAYDHQRLRHRRGDPTPTRRTSSGTPSRGSDPQPPACIAYALQRRLGQDGLSFQDLVAEVRRDLCARYLGDAQLSLAEVAFLTGFSEASTFYRAFKQWTGQTPAEYRRQRAGG
jgi:helix-turn-helix protein